MNCVLIFTTEPLPLPDHATTGAGLRAWGLAEGLRSRGFHVEIATTTPEHSAEYVQSVRRDSLGTLIDSVKPNVIVMQHWGLVYALPPLDIPVAIDLAGPHLLERKFWGTADPEIDESEKIAALRRADFVICGGERQREYFSYYLAKAGFNLPPDQIPVIPFSVPPEETQGEPEPESEITFIYGGAFLAWQNPEKPIRWLLDELDHAGKGRLLFYGGIHPTLDASSGQFSALYEMLVSHPRVVMKGWKGFDNLIKEYAQEGHVALDLMERNPERELAYTTRTMVYLYCGLPVIYNNYSELSQLIESHNCGWCLDPEDEKRFRKLVRLLINDPQLAIKLRLSARRFAGTQSWNKTIGPLADFCQAPARRSSTAVISGISKSNHHLSFLLLLRNFFPVPGKIIGILVYIPVWIVSRYLSFLLKQNNSSRAHKK